MEFGRHDVRRIAALARLHLTVTELDGFAAQLGNVLDHVAALGDGNEAEDGIADAPRALRPDVAAHDPLKRQPRDFAPGWTDGFFSVPRLSAFDEPAGPDTRDD